MKPHVHPWNSPLVVFVVVFCLVLATGTFVARELNANARGAERPAKLAFVTDWQSLAAVGHSRGTASAPVRVVLFADYQCPGCAELHRVLAVAADSMQHRLQIVTRHFPLFGHQFARAAANAAECAAEQGRFEAFEDVTYQLQDSIGIVSWESFGRRAAVSDSSAFSRCVKEERYRTVVDRDRNAAQTLKLAGTPVYIVNGHAYFGAPPLKDLMKQLRDRDQHARSFPRLVPTLQAQTPSRSSAPQQPATNRGVPARRWLPAPAHVRTIAGPEGDELLLPGSLVATPNGQLALFDFGTMQLRAFSLEGRQLWRTGRKGSGPGEFRNAMDVKARANGELAVLDMGNRRITEVSSIGRLMRTIPLRFSSSRFIPLADTTIIGLTTEDSGAFWSAVNRRGEVVDRGDPPASIGAQTNLARELFTAPLSGGAVIAFRWSDTFAILNANGRIATIANGIEAVPFPAIKSYPMKMGKFTGRVSRIDPKAVPGALSVTSNGQQIFILFGGATVNRGRIVDVYSAASGGYIGSELLSAPALEIVSLPNGGFATLRSEPIPAIDIWSRPVPTVGARSDRKLPSAATKPAGARGKQP